MLPPSGSRRPRWPLTHLGRSGDGRRLSSVSSCSCARLPPCSCSFSSWKVGTEALRPLAGEPIWEFIERSGSYAAPLALLALRFNLGPQYAPRTAAAGDFRAGRKSIDGDYRRLD